MVGRQAVLQVRFLIHFVDLGFYLVYTRIILIETKADVISRICKWINHKMSCKMFKTNVIKEPGHGFDAKCDITLASAQKNAFHADATREFLSTNWRMSDPLLFYVFRLKSDCDSLGSVDRR